MLHYIDTLHIIKKTLHIIKKIYMYIYTYILKNVSSFSDISIYGIKIEQ